MTVRHAPTSDSDLMAGMNRRILDIDPTIAAQMGAEAISICKAGSYVAANGTEVDISDAVTRAVSARLSIPPGAQLPEGSLKLHGDMEIQVANETTTRAAQRLKETGERVLALNFANGAF